MKKKKVNLDAVKTFFDPHPGLAGAFFPIPKAVRETANKLNGSSIPLRDAVEKIKTITNGKVKVFENYIGLETKYVTPFGLVTNYYRVIRFKSTKPQT